MRRWAVFDGSLRSLRIALPSRLLRRRSPTRSVSARSSSASGGVRCADDEDAPKWQHRPVRPGWVGLVQQLLVLGDELFTTIIRQRLKYRPGSGARNPTEDRIRPTQYVQVGGLPGIY